MVSPGGAKRASTHPPVDPRCKEVEPTTMNGAPLFNTMVREWCHDVP